MRDEDLIRIEHKIDLIMFALQQAGLMHKELPSLIGIEEDICPVCTANIVIQIDPVEGKLLRNCNCKLPKTAYKLNIEPTKEASNADIRTEESPVPPNQEE